MIRKLETVVLALLVNALIRRSGYSWAVLTLLAIAAQAALEGLRFHFIPVWVSIVFLVLSHWRFGTLFTVLSVISLIISVVLLYLVPFFSMPQPSGRFSVGSRTVFYRSSEDRFQSARLFYPASIPLVHNPLKRSKLFGAHPQEILNEVAASIGPEGKILPYMTHVRFMHSHAWEGADVVNERDFGSGSIPVIVFSHGLYGFPEAYAGLCEDLASHGFLVAAPHHTDGSSFVLDQSGAPVYKFTPLPKGISTEDGYKFRYKQIDQRLSDVRSVLEWLATHNDSEFGGRLKLDAVSIVGHSFGGATAVEALFRVPSVVSGVGLDTWMEPVSSDAADYTPPHSMTNKSLFLLNSDLYFQTPAWLSRMQSLIKKYGPGRWLLETLPGSVHHSFVDFPGLWLAPALGRKMRYVGTISQPDAIATTVKKTVAFLQKARKEESARADAAVGAE